MPDIRSSMLCVLKIKCAAVANGWRNIITKEVGAGLNARARNSVFKILGGDFSTKCSLVAAVCSAVCSAVCVQCSEGQDVGSESG